MFKELFKSMRKSARLWSISKKLAKPADYADVFKLSKRFKEKDKYIEELIDIAEADEYVKSVMNEYEASRQNLRKLYEMLISFGAGQYAGGHYVAASSLVYASTLKFLLHVSIKQQFRVNDMDAKDSAIFITNRLIKYFEKGEVGKVSLETM